MPPGKKNKNAILAEIVREIEDATLKANNSYSIQQHIIEQCKNDFPWLNKNNVDYFRRANLPANNIIVIVKQPTVISDLSGMRNKVLKDTSSSTNNDALLDKNTNPSQNDVSSLITSNNNPSSSTNNNSSLINLTTINPSNASLSSTCNNQS